VDRTQEQSQSRGRRLLSGFAELLRNSRISWSLSRHISMVFLVLVLMGEAGVALFVMRDLGRSYATVERMYTGSVQGLLRVGDMQYDAQETRRSTLYALTTNDGNLQVTYADQSRDADRGVTEGIAQVLADARTAEQYKSRQQLANDWSDYLKVRDEVLGLILEGSPKEAVHLDLSLGVPEFERVRSDLDKVKKNYDEQASQQLATVAELSRASMTRLTAALVLGLFLGTFAIWAIQRSRMRNAIHLAQLQMDFVASVSHELRTPLTAILTAAENIRDGLVLSRERLFEHGSVITEQATQLMETVDQVLLFSAANENKLSHPLREVRVSEVIEDALRSTQSLIDEGGFFLETTIEPDLPPIIADVSVLSQCVQNLIANAVKYSGTKRWIGLSARMNREQNEILIGVRDRGLGIHDSDLKRIFEPFYRSPQVIAAKIQGTGLGLSIAKRSAEAFGGDLTVSTAQGSGTVFTVHLPAPKRAQQKVSNAESAIGGARA
jgi:signal transduction histidine kinase